MSGWLRRVLFGVGLAAAIVLLFGWIVLVAPFFSEFRRSVVQDALSRAIGQQVLIETDARALVGASAQVRVSDVSIPSEEIEGLNLAELRLLELDIDSLALLAGRIEIDNIRIDGLNVRLVRQEDGVTSWSDPPEDQAADTSAEQIAVKHENGIIAFLSDKNADVTSVSLSFDDHATGFEYLFALESLTLKQSADGKGRSVSSRGTLNEQPFQIEGHYPAGAPFSTSATMGEVALEFDGQGLPERPGGGFEGELVLDTGEIGDLLEILKLNRTVEGTGRLTARLVRQDTGLAVEDLRTVVELDDGSVFTLEGSADDIIESVDFDLVATGQLFREGQAPGKATKLEELELTNFTANLVSEAGVVEFKEVLLQTNLFESVLDEVGPITVGQVRRTESGGLALENVVAQTGPRDAPYLIARGGIEDLFQLKDLDFKGTLNAPASLVLDGFQNDTVQAFGGIAADFELSDATGQLSLSKLEARSEDTDLWTMRASAEARSFTSVDDVDFQLELDVPDGAAFLSALQLDPVDIGPVGVTAAAKGKDNGVETRVSINAGESRIDTVLNSSLSEGNQPTVRGAIRSPRLNMGDLENTAKAALQIASLKDRADANGVSRSGETAGPVLQPLVLEDPDLDPDSAVRPNADDGRIVQPLVLEEPEDAPGAVEVEPGGDGRTVQPLVLEFRPADGAPTDLFDSERIGRDLDLQVGIEIEKVVGQAGVSRVSSELVSKDGKADFGPLEFSYGGGYFKIAASVDFIDAPQTVRVTGATSGWDLGDILDGVGAGIKAHGKLNARFDLTGRHDSPRDFVNSMSGSVTVSMVDGAIASSLLELAGLGLFPWLFSEELRQGYTSIVCAVAPLSVSSGKATSNAMVVETKSVQLVVAGSVDWAQDRISLRGEPRPVGRPLGRSPWPFEVTGRMSNPDFRIRHNSILESIFSAPGAGQASQERTPCKPDALQAR